MAGTEHADATPGFVATTALPDGLSESGQPASPSRAERGGSRLLDVGVPRDGLGYHVRQVEMVVDDTTTTTAAAVNTTTSIPTTTHQDARARTRAQITTAGAAVAGPRACRGPVGAAALSDQQQGASGVRRRAEHTPPLSFRTDARPPLPPAPVIPVPAPPAALVDAPENGGLGSCVDPAYQALVSVHPLAHIPAPFPHARPGTQGTRSGRCVSKPPRGCGGSFGSPVERARIDELFLEGGLRSGGGREGAREGERRRTGLQTTVSVYIASRLLLSVLCASADGVRLRQASQPLLCKTEQGFDGGRARAAACVDLVEGSERRFLETVPSGSPSRGWHGKPTTTTTTTTTPATL